MLIFDLHHLAWRAFHTTGNLSFGTDRTGVIFGVLQEIKGTLEMFQDPDVVIACDSPQSKRRDIFPGYKKRPACSEEEAAAKGEAIRQINALKHHVFPAIGVRNVFEAEGLEADDIMARVVMSRKRKKPPWIITGDEDIFQLLEWCSIWMSNKHKRWSPKSFMQKYGIPVHEWSTYKALAGCTSDTVPGVRGVGPVNAMEYIQNRLKVGKKYDAIKLAEADGTYDLMKKLVTLPFPGTPKFTLRPTRFNRDGFLEVCEKYGFDSIAEDIDEWEELLQRRKR